MGLGIPFDLRNLNHGLPISTNLRVILGDISTTNISHIKHRTLGNVRIVGDSDKITPRSRTGLLQPRPQITGERTIIKSKGCKGLSLSGIDVRHHDAMEVGATRNQ